MSKIEERLEALGLSLPTPPAKAGSYAPAKKFAGNLYFISGCGPSIGSPITGCLGKDVTAEEGYEYAKNCMLNVLAVLKREIGDLDKVKNVVKVTCFVASTPDFYAQPQVANGGTELLIQLFGEEVGMPSRSGWVSVPCPLNMPVETGSSLRGRRIKKQATERAVPRRGGLIMKFYGVV